MYIAVLVFQSKVGRRNCFRFRTVCRIPRIFRFGAVRCLIFFRLFGRGSRRRLCFLVRVLADGRTAGKISADAVHPSRKHHDSNKNHEDAADLYRIFYGGAVFFKEIQQGFGKQPDRQERKDKAQGINADQQKPGCRGRCRGGQEQHAGKSRADAGSPGEAERKAKDQGSQGIHRKAVRLKMKTMFFG